MRIIEVSERGSLDIPLSELIDGNGKLRIRADLIGKGLVEVRQFNDILRLKINGVVGRVPLTDSVVLDIRPKFPVSNLNRMIYRTRVTLKNPFLIDRPYSRLSVSEFMPVPLIRSFSKVLRSLLHRGILREYLRAEVTCSPRPRTNFMKSHQRYWSRLKPSLAVVETFEHSYDNSINRCLKLAAQKALSLSKTSERLADCIPIIAEFLRQLNRVETISVREFQSGMIGVAVPSFRNDYNVAMAHAREIIRGTDHSLDIEKEGDYLESYIISLDDVFEHYIRSIISVIARANGGSYYTLDGNIRRNQKSLFEDNNKYKVMPDMIVVSEGTACLIGDAKYKIKPVEEDRYQIISHALSYGVRIALLVYPKPPRSAKSGLSRLGRIGSKGREIEVYEYFFDLAAELVDQEKEFFNTVVSLFSSDQS